MPSSTIALGHDKTEFQRDVVLKVFQMVEAKQADRMKYSEGLLLETLIEDGYIKLIRDNFIAVKVESGGRRYEITKKGKELLEELQTNV